MAIVVSIALYEAQPPPLVLYLIVTKDAPLHLCILLGLLMVLILLSGAQYLLILAVGIVLIGRANLIPIPIRI